MSEIYVWQEYNNDFWKREGEYPNLYSRLLDITSMLKWRRQFEMKKKEKTLRGDCLETVAFVEVD